MQNKIMFPLPAYSLLVLTKLLLTYFPKTELFNNPYFSLSLSNSFQLLNAISKYNTPITQAERHI